MSGLAVLENESIQSFNGRFLKYLSTIPKYMYTVAAIKDIYVGCLSAHSTDLAWAVTKDFPDFCADSTVTLESLVDLAMAWDRLHRRERQTAVGQAVSTATTSSAVVKALVIASTSAPSAPAPELQGQWRLSRIVYRS